LNDGSCFEGSKGEWLTRLWDIFVALASLSKTIVVVGNSFVPVPPAFLQSVHLSLEEEKLMKRFWQLEQYRTRLTIFQLQSANFQYGQNSRSNQCNYCSRKLIHWEHPQHFSACPMVKQQENNHH